MNRSVFEVCRIGLLMGIAGLFQPALSAPPLPGAIFTTDSSGSGVDLNIYATKDDVYLNGGPRHPGAASLPDGSYHVQVTDPGGATLLGTSVGAPNPTPFVVTGGKAGLIQLSAVLIKASDGAPGYDDTPNPGGVYKVWVSSVATFDNNSTKTDNFRVAPRAALQMASLCVDAFYDANANGINDDGQDLAGWRVEITDSIHLVRFTPTCEMLVAPEIYIVTAGRPVQPHWVATTPTSVTVALDPGDVQKVEFGSVCLGAGGGHTLGFWSNKNGQQVMNDGGSLEPELALLSGLNLRAATGNDFNPANYSQFRTWLLNATAANMAYMLSAQLSAMALNVEAAANNPGFVRSSAMVHAPGLLPFAPLPGLNRFGLIGVNDLMKAADAELRANGCTPAGSPFRAYQEALKNALDAANNDQIFVQRAPGPFSFEE